jgi:hypothetical protein
MLLEIYRIFSSGSANLLFFRACLDRSANRPKPRFDSSQNLEKPRLDRSVNLQKSCLETLWKPLKTISVQIFRNCWCGFLEFFKCGKNSLKLPYQCTEIDRLVFVRLRIDKTSIMNSCLADAHFSSLHMTKKCVVLECVARFLDGRE